MFVDKCKRSAVRIGHSLDHDGIRQKIIDGRLDAIQSSVDVLTKVFTNISLDFVVFKDRNQKAQSDP